MLGFWGEGIYIRLGGDHHTQYKQVTVALFSFVTLWNQSVFCPAVEGLQACITATDINECPFIMVCETGFTLVMVRNNM